MLPLLQREILLTKEKFQAQGITFLVLKIENPKQPTYHFQRCNTTKGCSSSFISFWVALIFDQLCVCVCHPFLTTVVLLLIHLLFHHNFLWLFLSFGVMYLYFSDCREFFSTNKRKNDSYKYLGVSPIFFFHLQKYWGLQTVSKNDYCFWQKESLQMRPLLRLKSTFGN